MPDRDAAAAARIAAIRCKRELWGWANSQIAGQNRGSPQMR